MPLGHQAGGVPGEVDAAVGVALDVAERACAQHGAPKRDVGGVGEDGRAKSMRPRSDRLDSERGIDGGTSLPQRIDHDVEHGVGRVRVGRCDIGAHDQAAVATLDGADANVGADVDQRFIGRGPMH